MRLHRCAEIGCHELIKLGFDYCDKHYQSRMNSYRDRLKQSQELKSQTLRGQRDKLEYNRNYNGNHMMTTTLALHEPSIKSLDL